jgi:uncharacterized membrane protein
MDYNPYAPPRAEATPQAPPRATHGGAAQPWESGTVLRAAFAILNARWPVVIPAFALTYVCMAPLVVVLNRMGHATAHDPRVLTTLVATSIRLVNVVLIQGFVTTGLLRILLEAARGRPVSLSALFGGADRFFAMAGVTFVTSVFVLLGSALYYYAPGSTVRVQYTLLALQYLVVYLGFCFAEYYVVDQNLGAVAALAAAWRATSGKHGSVLLSAIGAGVLCFSGAMLCGVGMLVTGPAAMLCFTVMYLRITGGGNDSSLEREGASGQERAG